jgi:glycosyltransferase involved in cell wall biosynthesis
MPADISFIIPCFNHGPFLQRAIDSVHKIKSLQTEIIIVNDGSTDADTIKILGALEQEGRVQVMHQINAGPGAARNTGIRASSGKYIIPLDADDMIHPEYPEAAFRLMEAQPEISIAYADFQQFGEAAERMRYKPYCLQELLLQNSIGAAAIYRKSAWQAVSGYDESLRNGLGWEDWELWLHFAYAGLRFHYLDMIGYDYYYHAASRERAFLKDKTKVNAIIAYFEQKYPDFYSPAALHNHFVKELRKAPAGMFVKLVMAAFFPKKYQRLVAEGRIRQYLL